MMTDLPRLPIRKRGAFAFDHEFRHASVGAVGVWICRLVTTVGPETWCVLIRSPDMPDELCCTLNSAGHPEFSRYIATQAMIVTTALEQALARNAALGASTPLAWPERA